MTSFKRVVVILVITICTASTQTILDDPGPTFEQNSPSLQNDFNQRETIMKDAILYLTPTQIRAFEASQGQNTNQDQFTEEDMRKVEEEVERQLKRQNVFNIEQNNNRNPTPNYPKIPPPVVEEPAEEAPMIYTNIKPQLQKLQWIPMPKQPEEKINFTPAQGQFPSSQNSYPLPQDNNPPPLESPKFPHQHFNLNNHKFPESYTYVKFFIDHKVHDTPKLQQFHPIPYEHNFEPEVKKNIEEPKYFVPEKQYKLVPYEYKTPEIPREQELNEIAKITSLLEKYNREQNTHAPEISNNQEEQFNKYQKEPEFKRAPTFEDQNINVDAQNFIRIEKENALARAEAILKAPPVVRKEVNVNRRPIPLNKPATPNVYGKQWFHRYSVENKKLLRRKSS